VEFLELSDERIGAGTVEVHRRSSDPDMPLCGHFDYWQSPLTDDPWSVTCEACIMLASRLGLDEF